MSNMPNKTYPLESRSDDFGTDTDCVVRATCSDQDHITFHVRLTGEVTVPQFAVRELMKSPHYMVADMLLDMLLPGWVACLKENTGQVARSAVAGIRVFDSEMTRTLK